jgi:hypothetical protein
MVSTSRPSSQNIHQNGDRQPPLPRMVPSKHRPRNRRQPPIHHNQILQDSPRRKNRDNTAHHLAPAHAAGLLEGAEGCSNCWRVGGLNFSPHTHNKTGLRRCR